MIIPSTPCIPPSEPACNHSLLILATIPTESTITLVGEGFMIHLSGQPQVQTPNNIQLKLDAFVIVALWF